MRIYIYFSTPHRCYALVFSNLQKKCNMNLCSLDYGYEHEFMLQLIFECHINNVTYFRKYLYVCGA